MMRPSFFSIGTRGSALALAQTRSVVHLLESKYRDLKIEQKIISTRGDAHPKIAIHLPTSEASGLFTRQLEDALLAGEIDMAIHSLKDLPIRIPEGLMLAAILPRASSTDLLISLEPHKISTLPRQATIGTSSPRRTEILRHIRPDFIFQAIRGNVPTRLRKLVFKESPDQLDALILAQAGLERLGYDFRIDDGRGFFDFEGRRLYLRELAAMLPAPGQGAIAIETRCENTPTSAALCVQVLHDENTALCVSTERLLLSYLGGGCHMALGALARVDNVVKKIHLQGVYFPYVGAIPRFGEASGHTPDEVALLVATMLGEKLAIS